MVAQVRGAKFELVNMENADNRIVVRYRPQDIKDSQIACVALIDVAGWAGFRSDTEYVRALPKKRHQIFPKE